MKTPTRLDMIHYATFLVEEAIKKDTGINVSVIQDFNNCSIVFSVEKLTLFINKLNDVKKTDAMYELAIKVLEKKISIREAIEQSKKIEKRFRK